MRGGSAAVVAMFAVYLGAPVFVAIAVVSFPKLFRYLRNLLAHESAQPYILAAEGRGIGKARILSHHLLPNLSPALFALLGVSDRSALRFTRYRAVSLAGGAQS